MPRPGCNLALGLKKVRVCRRARVGTPEPRRRPCDTKWLQWIKSEWDLWINRGRSLVDWNDGQIDEPLPAEIGSWFALCIPSIPLSVGGKCHLSVLLAGGGSGGWGWEWWWGGGYAPTHPEHPPGWPVPYCLSQAPCRGPRQPRAPLNTPCIQHIAFKKPLSCFVFRCIGVIA